MGTETQSEHLLGCPAMSAFKVRNYLIHKGSWQSLSTISFNFTNTERGFYEVRGIQNPSFLQQCSLANLSGPEC